MPSRFSDTPTFLPFFLSLISTPGDTFLLAYPPKLLHIRSVSFPLEHSQTMNMKIPATLPSFFPVLSFPLQPDFLFFRNSLINFLVFFFFLAKLTLTVRSGLECCTSQFYCPITDVYRDCSSSSSSLSPLNLQRCIFLIFLE